MTAFQKTVFSTLVSFTTFRGGNDKLTAMDAKFRKEKVEFYFLSVLCDLGGPRATFNTIVLSCKSQATMINSAMASASVLRFREMFVNTLELSQKPTPRSNWPFSLAT
jgi:hypothetical protein